MDTIIVRGERYISCLRGFLCRPNREESHNVFHQSYLVQCSQRSRNCDIPSFTIKGELHRFQSRSQNYCALWWLAEDKKQGRGGKCGKVQSKRQERTRRLRGGTRDEPTGLRRTTRARKKAATIVTNLPQKHPFLPAY